MMIKMISFSLVCDYDQSLTKLAMIIFPNEQHIVCSAEFSDSTAIEHAIAIK